MADIARDALPYLIYTGTGVYTEGEVMKEKDIYGVISLLMAIISACSAEYGYAGLAVFMALFSINTMITPLLNGVK